MSISAGDTNAGGTNVVSITGVTTIATITGSAGVDQITLGTDAIAATVTGGLGADVLTLTTSTAIKVVVGAGESVMAAAATALTGDSVVTFTSTADTLSFGGPAGATANFATATLANAAVADFNALIALVNTAADTALTATVKYAVITVGTITTFATNNGLKYVIYDTNGDGDYTEGTDAIVQIGAVTIAATDIVA